MDWELLWMTLVLLAIPFLCAAWVVTLFLVVDSWMTLGVLKARREREERKAKQEDRS